MKYPWPVPAMYIDLMTGMFLKKVLFQHILQILVHFIIIDIVDIINNPNF